MKLTGEARTRMMRAVWGMIWRHNDAQQYRHARRVGIHVDQYQRSPLMMAVMAWEGPE